MNLLLRNGCAAACLFLAAGCASRTTVGHHWTHDSFGASISRAFLSYDPERDGLYRDFQWRKKQDINLTIRRHVFNHNPYNPFQPDDPGLYEPRPPHSLLPRPWNYIHVEGAVVGAIIYASGGMFIPVPIDSVIGTMEEGGGREFEEGVTVVTESFLHEDLRGNRRGPEDSP